VEYGIPTPIIIITYNYYRFCKYVFLTCPNMYGDSSFIAALATGGFMWLYAPSHGYAL